jgi:hypothetical protein
MPMKVQETLHLQIFIFTAISYAHFEATVKWHPRIMALLYTMWRQKNTNCSVHVLLGKHLWTSMGPKWQSGVEVSGSCFGFLKPREHVGSAELRDCAHSTRFHCTFVFLSLSQNINCEHLPSVCQLNVLVCWNSVMANAGWKQYLHAQFVFSRNVHSLAAWNNASQSLYIVHFIKWWCKIQPFVVSHKSFQKLSYFQTNHTNSFPYS